ncbi:ABC transporter permease [Paenibacillus mesotrionivorans]|uniref:ABC transporter permease n=1 Tax=Paenibacillus mesotrionivorans TaxID=3160968 RepID=A0ACC7P277_9BACL
MLAMQTWRACRSLFRVRMAEGLQYRVAALSGAMVGVFWAIIECVVYTVFYTYSQDGGWNHNGFGLEQTISYIWLAQGIFVFQAMSIDSEILTKINKGDVALELCRPMDLYLHWLVKSAAGKLGTNWLRGVLTIVAGILMPAGYALAGPASAGGFLLFLLSVVLAFLLCSAYAMLVTAIRLNTTWGDGPFYMLMLLSAVLSGTYLPLRLWPDSLQTFLRLQPFGGFADLPAQLYTGSLTPGTAWPGMMLQLFWIVVFVVVGRTIMKSRLKHLIIQGG